MNTEFYAQNILTSWWLELHLAMPFFSSLDMLLICNLQICECPVLFARLEVLNISGNRLTDACGSYLSTILENCTGKFQTFKTFSKWLLMCFSWKSLCQSVHLQGLSKGFVELICVEHQLCMLEDASIFFPPRILICFAHKCSFCFVALYSLNIERCSITTRTIQKVADALNASLVLAQLSIGALYLAHLLYYIL
jgi:hypothetical protein